MNKEFPDNVQPPDGYRLRDIQLELSLKPFFDTTPRTREAVCREIFLQWQALWRHAERISILLWVAEGSEILEYDGNPETAFEWARYHGAPNRHRWELPDKAISEDPDHNAIGVNVGARDPEQKGVHCRAYLYRPEPAVFTYGWLGELVGDLKRIGTAMTGRPVLVGQGFDIGPEFAKSRFKFDWHREILGDGPIFKQQFVSCEAVLKGDQRTYAAFPHGIPDGITIGEFLGKQIRALFDDCGHDFIWLSNGFGFALEPWSFVGKIFDGTAYHPEQAGPTRDRILAFWKSLREAIGLDVNIRTRGTNLATGIDIGSDASPLKQIYDQNPAVDAPVNSPWAALDGDLGLELSGWMSHIAVHPGETYRFRFYIHDPWWLNSPWLDRYGRQPHDLFLPLSVSRLNASGGVEIPRDLSLLTVDDSHGCMPLQVPNEVTAWFLRARECAPDAPGPLVWVYPFDEWHELGLELGMPERPLHADAWIGQVINAGIPLNTVADVGELSRALAARPGLAQGRLFCAPAPRPGSAYEATVRALLERGADVLFFGPLFAGSFLWQALGLAAGQPLDGDFALELDPGGPRNMRHLDFLSAGGWCEVPDEAAGVEPLVTILALQDKHRRVAFRMAGTPSGGRIGWLRASLTTGEFDPRNPQPVRGPILKPMREPGFLANGDLARRVLGHFDWNLAGEIAAGDPKPPYLTAHQSANALVLCGYHRNEKSTQRVRTPLGAPLLLNRHNEIDGAGRTVVCGETAWQSEVRVFAGAGGEGQLLVCRELVPVMHGVHRRILVSGLRGTVLAILPHPAHLGTLRLLVDPKFPYFLGRELDTRTADLHGHLVVATPPLSGELLIEW